MTMTLKKILSVLCAAAFLSSALIPIRTAVAAEDWPVWPRKPGVAPPAAPAPGEEQKKEAAAVLGTGEESGKKVAAGTSAGTIGLYALGGALVIGGIVAIASGGGGGGGGGTTSGH